MLNKDEPLTKRGQDRLENPFQVGRRGGEASWILALGLVVITAI